MCKEENKTENRKREHAERTHTEQEQCMQGREVGRKGCLAVTPQGAI